MGSRGQAPIMQESRGHYVSVSIIHHSIGLLLRLFGFELSILYVNYKIKKLLITAVLLVVTNT